MAEHLFRDGVGEWLRPGPGPEDGVVICSRARLARNLAGFNFMPRLASEDRHVIMDAAAEALIQAMNSDLTPAAAGDEPDADTGGDADTFCWHSLSTLDSLRRQMLVERHLVSREHAEGDAPRAVAFDRAERRSIMVLEEDHLRIQAFESGLRLGPALASAARLETALERSLDFAFDARFGYLTCCPTNVGTGLRISVLLHLPALAACGHAEKAFRAAQELRLAVRGLYGEGTQAFGDLYQVSNQSTLGRAEEDIVADLEAVILPLADYERQARLRLMEKERRRLEDMVWRSWGILSNARILASEEAMKHLSMLRLGRAIGWLPELSMRDWGEWFLYSQPAHLQARWGRRRKAAERDGMRADLFRARLAGGDPTSATATE